MAASSLLALIDDISSILDDVAVLTKTAAAKTTGVMGDDLALNAEQVSGVNVERELPVVWAVAKGSFVNKLILVPAALAISAFFPGAIMPLMMIGGLYLCYEGFEKVAHKLLHSASDDHEHREKHLASLADPKADVVSVERDKIKGAIRTDFVLSAEIIVITLGTMSTAPFLQQVLALSAVAIGATVFVYGLVAGIVKLDDLGLALRAKGSAFARKIGNGILRTAPLMMKSLSVLGTAAMFTVGGSILEHGIAPVHHLAESIAEPMSTRSGVLGTIVRTLLDAIVGVVAGGLAVGVMLLVQRMRKPKPVVAALLACVVMLGGSMPLPAQVVRVGDLNTRQIRALDRNRTVVFLQGGMLEEHGPYLPAFTDGILSDRLTREVAAGVVAKKPRWTALVFPPVSVGASGSNEIGKQFTFPGTYAIRSSTLRAIYMDIASELGEQGFKWVMVVHVHGSPLHIGALDDAGDFFHDTYGGRMVNLWGLLPVLGGWGSAMSIMTPAQKKEDGVSLHGGADEHSLMLFLQPNLVAKDFRSAKSVTGASYAESFAAARVKDWPGYIGAPRVASAALGQHIWTAFSSAALKTTLEILGGTDPSTYPRYLSFLVKDPLYQDWIKSASDRDSTLGARQRAWSAGRKKGS